MLLQDKRPQRITWHSQDERAQSQVDSLLISSRWRSSIKNCRAYRRADTGVKNGFGHMVLEAPLAIKITPRKRMQPPPRYDAARLQDKAVVVEFHLELSNRSDILLADDDNKPTTINLEYKWEKIRYTIKDAFKQVLGGQKRKQKKCHDFPSTQTLPNNGTTTLQLSSPNTTSAQLSQPAPYSNVNVDPLPSIQEIKEAIKKLRHQKKPGTDFIPAKVYEAAPILAEKLQKLFC
ncbi:hypothetical protein QYM36_010962 [Artemia franciscana]|uniref:Uncharacterized protein n=1 Tax=Artemia franciscana TaxID=6661 RepID=A0AA88L3Z2_ARTSF|nr:hypothetical protein QYM36_010962 [Artemia franciscana]